jgi:prepilin-type N-terminal cleavage/methylation domain-containing protein
MKNKKLKKGFTLIELLVVVLIIGILAAIALPQYRKAVLKSRTARMLSNISSLYDALEIYRYTHGDYPALPNTPTAEQMNGVLDISITLDPDMNYYYFPGSYVSIRQNNGRINFNIARGLNPSGTGVHKKGVTSCFIGSTDNIESKDICEALCGEMEFISSYWWCEI